MKKNETDDFYKTDIEPLISALKNKCRKNKIPFFICVCTNPGTLVNNCNDNIFQYKNPEYKYNMVSPYYCKMNLNSDVIAECIKVSRGFHAVPYIEGFNDADYVLNPELLKTKNKINLSEIYAEEEKNSETDM